MCGIYGQYNYATARPVERVDLELATRSMAHRGPDDEGYFLAGPIGLGFRRLSIIDVGGGHQPMSDAERTVCVVFNGEIYNFLELRKELEAKGHTFRTRSDTEAIVHGYKEWGEQCLDRFRGMFGLAVWDAERRKLIIARDAMGIKPVYYRLDSESVSFSSELRGLTAGQSQPSELDPTSVSLFLRHRYTPSPRTLFRGIQKLAPGTMLVVENGVARVRRWYEFEPAPFAARRSIRDAAEELLDLYRGALRRHLISDVPVGLLLSGGIDSALLLALMSETGSGWKTYSVGYGTSYRDDELEDARRTASLFGASHTSVQMSRAEFETALPAVVASLEEPVAASSIVPMYMVCARARQDVKVALVGQGPDELFGGYTRHLGVSYGYCWRAAPNWLRRGVEHVVMKLPRNATLKRGLYSLAVSDRLERYRDVLSIAPGDVIDGLFRDGTLAAGSAEAVFECWRDISQRIDRSDELGGFQWLELQSTLPDELLMYTDKLSMAHGLEARVPYLDRNIVEYAARLEATSKIRWLSRKVVHRKVCASFLPGEIIKRKKRGFAANVVDDWFVSCVGARMDTTLRDESSLMYRILNPRSVHRLLDEHKSGRADNHKLLFSLVVLEQWMRGNGARFDHAARRKSA